MDLPKLRKYIEIYFLDKNFESVERQPKQDLDLIYKNRDSEWSIALLADQKSAMDYLKAFESGMQTLISHHQTNKDAKSSHMALALAFDSTLAGKGRSFRRALNKYSNSIVFEDLGIHLLLVLDEGKVEHNPPEQVNVILRNLNLRIAAKKSRR